MPLEALHEAKRKTVGIKQTTKAVLQGSAKVVFVAKDADERVLRELTGACRERKVTMIEAEDMAALGKACGIDVGAAAAAITDE